MRIVASPPDVLFVTGNKGKLAEVQAILGSSVSLSNITIDLDELQGPTPEYIVTAKAKLAFATVGRPVMIEDTSLCFEALKGLPGPYIKWFLDSLGPDGLHKMLAPFENQRVYASCIFTVCYSEKDVVLLEGRCYGTIVAPRGAMGFGWDSIFEPEDQVTGADGSRKTFAEMTKEEKNAISHRARALAKVKTHFAERGDEKGNSKKRSREPEGSS